MLYSIAQALNPTCARICMCTKCLCLYNVCYMLLIWNNEPHMSYSTIDVPLYELSQLHASLSDKRPVVYKTIPFARFTHLSEFILKRRLCHRVFVCMHTYIHTYLRACLSSYLVAYLCTYICAYVPIHAGIHKYNHTCIHTWIPTYRHTCLPDTYIHAPR